MSTRLRSEYPAESRSGEVPLVVDCTGLAPAAGTLACRGCGRRVRILWVTPRHLARCGDCFDPTRISAGARRPPTSVSTSEGSPASNSATGRTGDVGAFDGPRLP